MYFKTLRLINFKGFQDCRIDLRRQTNVLTGANNAGKTTAISALRVFAAAIHRARRIRPNGSVELGTGVRRGWMIPAAAYIEAGFVVENLRYDFRPSRTSIILTTGSRYEVRIDWPAPIETGDTALPAAVLSVSAPDGGIAKDARAILRENIPSIGVVPQLTPVDDEEFYVQEEAFGRGVISRRSSRYFRNALFRLSESEWKEFEEFAISQTPEICGLEIARDYSNGKQLLSLYFLEGATRHTREIVWAGDGLQIWLQVLYFVWRSQSVDVRLLDEPEVFLHPDLQRRLAQLVFEMGGQNILATHSIEVVAEADVGSVICIDRMRRSARRPRATGALSSIGRLLGSGFEMGVARALRVPFILFVEGTDSVVIRQFARTLGLEELAREHNYVVLRLGGFSRASRASVVADTLSDLGADVQCQVILDRDFRSDELVRSTIASVQGQRIDCHIWKRREIENYLLVPGAFSRASGLDGSTCREELDSIVSAQEEETFIQFSRDRQLEYQSSHGSLSGKEADRETRETLDEFKRTWSRGTGRYSFVDAKEVVREFNRRVDSFGCKTVSARSLARSLQPEDIDGEVIDCLGRMETILRGLRSNV